MFSSSGISPCTVPPSVPLLSSLAGSPCLSSLYSPCCQDSFPVFIHKEIWALWVSLLLLLDLVLCPNFSTLWHPTRCLLNKRQFFLELICLLKPTLHSHTCSPSSLPCLCHKQMKQGISPQRAVKNKIQPSKFADLIGFIKGFMNQAASLLESSEKVFISRSMGQEVINKRKKGFVLGLVTYPKGESQGVLSYRWPHLCFAGWKECWPENSWQTSLLGKVQRAVRLAIERGLVTCSSTSDSILGLWLFFQQNL